MRKHRTAKGREFNMQAFVDSRGDSVAVGNSGRNARGDLLGPGGQVIATNQEINNRFHDRQSKGRTAQVKINPMEQEVGRKEVIGADGVARWEITYADGSVEMQEMPNQPPPKKSKTTVNNTDINTNTDTGAV
jgi:hypothetical protein